MKPATTPTGRKNLAALAALLLALSASAVTGCKAVSQAQNAQGVRQFQQGQYQAAIQRFQKAVASDPNNANSYYNLASAYHRLGDLNHRQEDLAQAENYYHQCLDHDQNHRDCYRAFAVLLVEEHRSEEGLRLLEAWSLRSPSSSAPKVELARLYREFGQRDAAREQLLEALSVNPYDSQASAALGQLYEEQGNQAQALVNYQRSLGQNNFQPELAARANSIRSAMGTNTIVPPDPATGTRMVGSGSPPLR
jgi:tetratricopeptide (TPR) repeat protein